MDAQIIRGDLPEWARGDGYGYGYGYGDGDGYGSGYGYGDGDGSGSGYDIARCSPLPLRVTINDLVRLKACSDQRDLFVQVFPNGATWPDDIEKARAAGLDLEWARTNLGLMEPK